MLMGIKISALMSLDQLCSALTSRLHKLFEERAIVLLRQASRTGLGKRARRQGAEQTRKARGLRGLDGQAGVFFQQGHVGAGLEVSDQGATHAV